MQDSSSTPGASSQPTASAAADKVPTAQKIAYGLGTSNEMWGSWLYPSLVWPVFNIFLHVSPALVSVALMCNRLADVFADPFFGWWSDNTRTRFGRRRPFILVGAILAGLLLPALVFVQPGWSERSYFWYMAVSSAVYICVVASFSIPWNSLGNELTPDYHERTALFSVKNAMQKIAEIATFAAAAFCTATVWVGADKTNALDRLLTMLSDSATWFKNIFASLFTADLSRLTALLHTPFGWQAASADQQPNVLLGAQVYTIMLGAMMIISGIIIFSVVKERYYEKLVTKQQNVKLTEGIWKCLQCRPFRAQIAMALSYGLGTSMVGALGFYTTVYYVCGGNLTVGSLWNFGMGLASMLFGLAGIPVYAWVARRFGKRSAMLVVQISAILVFISTWWLYNPNIPWLQLFASGMIAFTQGGFWMLYGAMGPDVIDYDELECGKRREGAFTSCGTWIMKVGLALGIGASGLILAFTGFKAELGGAQAPEALTNIRFFLAAIPIGGLLVAMAALARFGLTPEKMADIRRQLEARRGQV
jgi:GPH family glycoside/pentoside/hexuronide:cation symporter